MTAFADHVALFLEDLFALQPNVATAIGDHRYDERWPDMTETGRQARLAFLDRWTATFAGAGAGPLTADERIDRDLVLGELAEMRFADAELREETWDPMAWVYLLGMGLLPLITREFAPLHVRLASVAGRLEGIPRIIEEARVTLGSGPRPIARLHAEVAGRRIAGVADLGRDAVAIAEAAASDDADVAAVLPRLRAAVATAATALEAIGNHLAADVAPSATGDAALGYDLFAAKLRHTLRDPDVTPEAVLAHAEAEFAAVRAEMVRIAREIWPRWRPGEPAPNDEGELVRGTLDAIADDHPEGDAMVAFCRDELGRIEAFCRDLGVIGLVDEPLEIEWMPEFMRSYATAMLDSPGPLDIGQKTFFAITPPRADWTADEVESYLREMNVRQLRLLTIHEAVPGHYLQMAYANRGSSLARRVFRSGLFAEGWAVYVTQVLLDRGYGARRPGPVARPLEVLPADRRQRDPRRPHPYHGHDERGGDQRSWLTARSRSVPRRSPRTSARASPPPNCPRTSWVRSGCGTWRTRPGAEPRRRQGPVPTRCLRREWSAATRPRPGSTSGRTSRRSSRTVPHRSLSCAASFSGSE